MHLMEVRDDQGLSFVDAVGMIMSSRTHGREVRIVFPILSALIFHPLTGGPAALAWLMGYLSIQAVEVLLFREGRVSGERMARVALGLVMLGNLAFAILPMLLAGRGGATGAALGILMLGGALIHGVLANSGSRLVAACAAWPLLFALAWLPPLMIAHGVPGYSAFMLGCAGLMFCSTAFGAWRRMSSDMLVLRKARQQADRANHAKSDFLTMISHEIRTPLNGVMGMAQSLARDNLTVDQKQRLDTLIMSGQGLDEMIGEVLDLSRIEANVLSLDVVAFDLRETVTRVINPFTAIARAKGVDISVSLCPSLAPAYLGDPVRIRQVMHNLLSNAIQRTDVGSILISASRDAEGVMLSVCDSGRSVREDRLATIFDKYASLDWAAAAPGGSAGLGLGLYMANALAIRMGGAITATNRVPRGLCLTASLPLAAAEMIPPPAPVAPEAASMPTALRVLAAEDHPVNRLVLEALLDQICVIPTMVENGQLAVQACRDSDWDLVLMDVQMPVLDGVSAARQIADEARAAGRIPPPIIAVTANVMAHQLQEYAGAGMEFCIAKPVEAGVLFEAMREALNRRKAHDVASCNSASAAGRSHM